MEKKIFNVTLCKVFRETKITVSKKRLFFPRTHCNYNPTQSLGSYFRYEVPEVGCELFLVEAFSKFTTFKYISKFKIYLKDLLAHFFFSTESKILTRRNSTAKF